MADPWDRPPYPTRGDDEDDFTYAAIGRVVCTWEWLEVEFSRLYSIFVGRPNEASAMRAYGEGRNIFRDRIAGLQGMSAAFFVSIPDQAIEAKFDELVCRAKGWSGRRNDVAHGIVRPIEWVANLIPHFSGARDGRHHFCLLPATYDKRRFDSNDRPEYIFAASDMLEFEEAIHWLMREVSDYGQSLLPAEERDEGLP